MCHNQFLYHSTFLFFSFSPSVAMSFDINTNLCIFCNDKSDCAVQELHNRLKTPLISMRTTLKLLTFQAQLFKHTHNQFNMIQTMDIYSRYAWTLIYLYFLNIRLGSLCPWNQFVKLKKKLFTFISSHWNREMIYMFDWPHHNNFSQNQMQTPLLSAKTSRITCWKYFGTKVLEVGKNRK